MAIIGIAMLVTLQQMTISYRETEQSLDRVFAYQKALAMLAEIQSTVERGVAADGITLESYDDQATPNPVLTTLTDSGAPIAPDHPSSGNSQRQGEWLWARQVSVDPVPSSEQMRYVRVRVDRRLQSGKLVPAASIGAVVNLPVDSFPATHVHDLYVLAIGESPSLAGPLHRLRVALDSALAEISATSHGLRYRVHWITKNGYGRDSSYAPYLNVDEVPSAAADFVYWYPSSPGSSDRLYSTDLIEGRLRTSAGFVHDYDSVANPIPHAVADRFNHCVRAPTARRIHAQRVLAGLEDIDEPPLQVLLEDMAAEPERFRNAIFLNLHGEALPCPPLRNYADAAKAPTRLPGVRAVTHPERLWTPRDPDEDGDHADSLDAHLRVYAFKTDPGVGADVLAEPITLQILGPDLTGNVNGQNPGVTTTLTIRALAGGVDRGGALSGDLAYYAFSNAKSAAGSPAPNEMHYEVGYVGSPVSYTWIKLHNTPLITPRVGQQGLAPGGRLYGLDYVPSPVTAGGTFGMDLATLDSDGARPRNTARWRITVPREVFAPGFPGGSWADQDTLLDVVTRLGDDLTTGRTWPTPHEPANASETFTWWSSSPSAVPITERYQFQGDPRHFPYADLVVGGNSFAHGYNWNFDDLSTPSFTPPAHYWPCLDASRLVDGGTGGCDFDAPRLVGVWRSALQRCRGVFNNFEGLLAGAIVLGGEITWKPEVGDLRPSALRVHGNLFGLGAAEFAYDALLAVSPYEADPAAAPGYAGPTPATIEKRGHSLVVDSLSGFWAKDWLGELAPDSTTSYESIGNLVVPRFRRVLRSEYVPSDLPSGTSFDAPCGSHSYNQGAASLLQVASGAGGPFVQTPRLFGATPPEFAEQVRELLEVAGADADPGTEWRWTSGFDASLAEPTHMAHGDTFPTQYLAEFERQASVDGGSAATVWGLTSPSGDTAFFSVMGATPLDERQRARAIRQSAVLGVRALHVANQPSYSVGVVPPVTVKILEPVAEQTFTNPTSVLVRWRSRFTRFDGKPLTEAHGPTYSGSEIELGYVVLVSSDDGRTWWYASDGTPAVAGRWLSTSSPYWQPDAGAGDESYAMALPEARVPQGSYLIRVECYDVGRETNYGYHQQWIHVERR